MKWVYANTPEPMVSELRRSHPGEPRYVLSIIRIFYKVQRSEQTATLKKAIL
jgi:hypothetical protein